MKKSGWFFLGVSIVIVGNLYLHSRVDREIKVLEKQLAQQQLENLLLRKEIEDINNEMKPIRITNQIMEELANQKKEELKSSQKQTKTAIKF